MSIEDQGHFSTLAQDHLHMNIKLAFPSSHLTIFREVLNVSLYVQGNENSSTYIHTHNAGHMTKMAAMPIYGKTL